VDLDVQRGQLATEGRNLSHKNKLYRGDQRGHQMDAASTAKRGTNTLDAGRMYQRTLSVHRRVN